MEKGQCITECRLRDDYCPVVIHVLPFVLPGPGLLASGGGLIVAWRVQILDNCGVADYEP